MVTGTETPEGTILMQARIIRDLRTENASLKTIVEKFTAERSKGQGTANKQSKYAAQIAARLSERIVYNEFLSQSLRDYVAWEVRQLLTL